MTDRRNRDQDAVHCGAAASCELSFEDGRPAVRVIEALARADGTSPAELTPPLYETIDPDALDRLFGAGRSERRRSGGVLTFATSDVEVVVDWRDEYVRVFETAED